MDGGAQISVNVSDVICWTEIHIQHWDNPDRWAVHNRRGQADPFSINLLINFQIVNYESKLLSWSRLLGYKSVVSRGRTSIV